MALTSSRAVALRGRPPGQASGIRGAISAHCPSVRSVVEARRLRPLRALVPVPSANPEPMMHPQPVRARFPNTL
jgi:hypothetical protein